uniref:Uncharacterized protein n=1 Tax=Arundo donax TaxID=35708 RepID=A0A0A8ZKF5_ARUDO
MKDPLTNIHYPSHPSAKLFKTMAS